MGRVTVRCEHYGNTAFVEIGEKGQIYLGLGADTEDEASVRLTMGEAKALAAMLHNAVWNVAEIQRAALR